MNERWVLNASPVIVLARAGVEGLLLQLPDQVIIPEAVKVEIMASPAGDPARRMLVSGKFVVVDTPIKRDEIIEIINNHREELSVQYGVKSLALFGSVARDEATTTSDLDLLVEFDQPVGLFGLFALQDHLESLFDRSVDIGTPDSLKPQLRDRVMEECIPVM